MHALTQPWSHGFMQRALLELVLLGVVGGIVGCWVLFYDLAYSTESLAHGLFPGLVGAALLGVPLLAGGAVGVLGAAVGVAVVRRTPTLGSDTAVAVVVTSLFGVGVLLALAPAAPPGLGGLLFGDLLGVTSGDLISSGALAAAAVVALAVLHRPLLLVGFDRTTAHAFGARPLFVDLALLALIAVAIVIGVRALGNLLIVALLVGPAATARLLVCRMPRLMAVAAAIAIATSIGGLYLSYYASLAAGASVAAVMVGAYLAALFGVLGRSVLSRT
ncbi:MAG TPA: metal ABC transporter permease [Gaiellaceae bacterium]|jgi:ABC-type Mn2+/Zn2+ transport system permease subunit